jgi:antitoxin component of MazEF toxin-antitoxin module
VSLQTQLCSLRLPKSLLELLNLRVGNSLDIEVRPDRLILRLPRNSITDDTLKQAQRDFRASWQQAGEDAWVELFGPNYD